MKKLCLWIFYFVLFFSGTSIKSQVILLNENFNSPGTPAGWTLINNSTGGDIINGGGGPDSAAWMLRADGYQYNSVFLNPIFHSNDLSQFYLSNSDAQGDDNPSPITNTIIQLPSISTNGHPNVTLQFYHNFWSAGPADSAMVEASIDGINWTRVYLENFNSEFQIGAADAFVQQSVNLDAFSNISNLRLRFHYKASWGFYWALDNVKITGSGTGTCSSNNWEGIVSNVWENPANWSCGTVPDVNTVVYINSGKPNYPVVNSMASCKTLYSYSGSAVTINTGFTLIITGP
ncbi:MAG: hypothetical protein ABIT81_01965 [Ferruginibacter sp.]